MPHTSGAHDHADDAESLMDTIASRSRGALHGITQVEARRAQLAAAHAALDLPTGEQQQVLREWLEMLGLLAPREIPTEPEPVPPRPKPPAPDPADWWWAYDPAVPGTASHLVYRPSRRRACNRRDPADDNRDWQPADQDHPPCRTCRNTTIGKALAARYEEEQ